jgi:hypothetical protein
LHRKLYDHLTGMSTPTRHGPVTSIVIPPVSLSGIQTPASRDSASFISTVDSISLEPMVHAATAAVSALKDQSRQNIAYDYSIPTPSSAPNDTEDIE